MNQTRSRLFRIVCCAMVVVSCSELPQVSSGETPRTPTLVTTWDFDLSPLDPHLENPWTPELEAEFQQRAKETLQYYAGQKYGNTHGENEKRSYSLAMLDFLAGNREGAIAFLQSEDAQASDHAHTEGIDYYFCFTLKGQIRKYFLFGKYLDPGYQQRMYRGAKAWTEQDPKGRPHPLYGNGDGTGKDWSIQRRGGWVDGRNTDNLRAMREVAIYLMAEETGNEETRQLYQQKLQSYVSTLYHIGMGEWDSENYLGHTFVAYLNLYDFAKNSEVKALAKAALDWMSTAAAIKYYHGGWGAPNKRDYGAANVVFGASAARFFWIYFGDNSIPNPKPERDLIHAMTSRYRPPLAVVALARKQFDKPIELWATKPVYENWKEGKDKSPGYWETTWIGQQFQMGSVVSAWPDSDVGAFKVMAQNSQRGVDYFTVNTGGDWVKPGKNSGDQIGQFRNQLIWLRSPSDQPFLFQLPKTAKLEKEQNIWFVQLEQTWLAIFPIHLQDGQVITITDQKYKERYSQEMTLKATPQSSPYSGFILEVGEPNTHGNFAHFKRIIKTKSQVNLQELFQGGKVEFVSSQGDRLELQYNPQNLLPLVKRNGVLFDYGANFSLYQSFPDASLVSLGWQKGQLTVKAGGYTFETQVGGGERIKP